MCLDVRFFRRRVLLFCLPSFIIIAHVLLRFLHLFGIKHNNLAHYWRREFINYEISGTTSGITKHKDSLRFRNIIIFAKSRTGSTVLAKLLASHNYLYIREPFHPMLGQLYGDNTLSTREHARIIKDLLECNYSNLDVSNISISLINNDMCREIPKELCQLNVPDVSRLYCLKLPVQIIKTTHLSFAQAAFAMEASKRRTAVIHLLRDPRGMVASRKEMSKYYYGSPVSRWEIICRDFISDLIDAEIFKTTFPERYFLLKYENLALEPVKTMRKLYDFLKMTFTVTRNYVLKTQMMIKHEKSLLNDLISTDRDSETRPGAWRKSLSFQEVLEIQKQCADFMTKLNYTFITNESDLLDESILIYSNNI